MTREEAYQTLTLYIKNPNLIKHHLATEAAMKGLANYFIQKGEQGIDPQKWGIVGLLHDADYELTHETPEQHTLVLAEKIGDSIEPDVLHAIQSHNYKNNSVLPQNKMDWAITCSDELTGLIIASALIHPDKKLASLTSEFIIDRMNDKSFSRKIDRETIRLCEEKLGIPLSEFVGIVLNSMKGISFSLGL